MFTNLLVRVGGGGTGGKGFKLRERGMSFEGVGLEMGEGRGVESVGFKVKTLELRNEGVDGVL